VISPARICSGPLPHRTLISTPPKTRPDIFRQRLRWKIHLLKPLRSSPHRLTFDHPYGRVRSWRVALREVPELNPQLRLFSPAPAVNPQVPPSRGKTSRQASLVLFLAVCPARRQTSTNFRACRRRRLFPIEQSFTSAGRPLFRPCEPDPSHRISAEQQEFQ